jgi:hypothetical protein
MGGKKANGLAKKRSRYAGLAGLARIAELARIGGLANFRTRALPALGAAAVLTATCTAGCSVFQATPGPAGMQKQILNGERVGAATRAHAGRAASAAAARAALSSGQPIPGKDVTAIGDSVMSGSAPALAQVMPGIYIDAMPDREMPAGLSIAARLAQSGQLRPVVVMGLGTNYIVTTAQLNELMQIIGPHRRLVLINTYVPDGWSKQVNATDAAFVHTNPSVVLADWYDTIRSRLYLLWPDQVHPMVPGTIVYAQLVYDAVQATRNVTGTMPVAQSVVEHGNG